MKKILALIIAVLLIISGTAFAAVPADEKAAAAEKEKVEKAAADQAKTEKAKAEKEANKVIDRLDMSLKAGGYTVSGVAQQAAANTDQGIQGAAGALLAARAPAAPEDMPPFAMGVEFDMMSIARSSIDPFNLDLSFDLAFGGYDNFGMNAIYYLGFLASGDFFGSTIGLDLAFDIYPQGNSPAGFYIGPIIGGRLYIYDPNFPGAPPGASGMEFAFVPGANIGYRFDLGGFLINTGILYGAVMSFKDAGIEVIHDFQFQICIGGYGQQNPPKEKKAEEQKKGEEK